MPNQSQIFLKKAEEKVFDLDHRQKLNFNIGKYSATVKKGVLQYADLDTVKRRAKNVKWKVMENLDKYLIEFEHHFTSRGGKVIWAETDKEANEEILKILKNKNATKVVKSKSMATEEIHLNDALEQEGIEVMETDLGEYIQQLDGEPPYHIVTPAMHKSKEDVARVFNEKLGTPLHLTPQEMTMVARKNLREKYVNADVGITGANFLIADTGAIELTENEGNGRLSVTFAKTHIVIVGIEKIIPSIYDLAMFLPLLATFGTGQRVTVYNSIISGARQEKEFDGPEEMYVVLLDNGRTRLLAEEKQREALYCIRCGACLNVCPVYKNIGGHTYGTTYSGPIGSVITPHFKGMENFKHLSFASTLCGNCTEVCPVKIDLHNLLLHNRKESVDKKMIDEHEKSTWKWWRRAMLSRTLMNLGGSGIKNFLFSHFFKNTWGKRRNMPLIAKKSFNQLWEER